MRHLRRREQGDVTAKRLGHGGNRARLHRHRQQALLHIALADLEGGVLECLIDAARRCLDLQRPGVTLVGADLGVHDDLVAERFFDVDHGLMHFVLNVDEIEGIARGGL